MVSNRVFSEGRSDLPRGQRANIVKKNIPCIEIPCGPESGLLDAGSIRLAGGSLQLMDNIFFFESLMPAEKAYCLILV